MGTRGCVGWTMTGKTYKETYNHYDSYPEWLGIRMIGAVKDLDVDDIRDWEEIIEISEATFNEVVEDDERNVLVVSR